MSCGYDPLLGYCVDEFGFDCAEADCDYYAVYGNGNGNPNSGNQGITVQPGGGAQLNPNPLNQYLQTFLSAFALLQHAPYVPTNQQPAQQPLYSPHNQPGYGGNPNLLNPGGTTSGKVELWIKNNTGVTLMLVGGVALYLMKSPRGR